MRLWYVRPAQPHVETPGDHSEPMAKFSDRELAVNELFHPATLETFKVWPRWSGSISTAPLQ
jgi:hypothetical protein